MSLSQIDRPRSFAALCAAAAVGLGFVYLTLAGAPVSYVAMNGAALALGLLTLGVLREAGRLGRVPYGAVSLLLAGLLLLVGLIGVSAEGVRRWIAVGGVSLQPGLVLMPLLALNVARSRDALSVLAVAIAALALALQPDRAMAGALAAGLAALAMVRFDRVVLAALGAALSGFAVTLVRPDASSAMPFVDQIFLSSFAVHPLAGLAVTGGAALMLAPAIAGLARDPGHRAAYAVFGAVWLAVIAAAALGNYPTPLVGYGGSAILGYLVSAMGLPPRAAVAADGDREPSVAPVDGSGTLRAGLA